MRWIKPCLPSSTRCLLADRSLFALENIARRQQVATRERGINNGIAAIPHLGKCYYRYGRAA